MKVKASAYVLLALIGLNSQATSDVWTSIDIKGTELETASVQVLGKFGVAARCNPQGINMVPDFSNSNTSHLCEKPRINSGSRTKLLEVYKRGNSYAAKIEITHATRPNEKGAAPKGQVQWVEFDPNSPFMQIYDERTGAVHPLEKYLKAAEEGKAVHVPEFEEPEHIDAALQESLERSTPGDDPGAKPTSPDVISAPEEIPDQGLFQSPLPGSRTVPAGPIEEPETRPLSANSNHCQMPIEPQKIDDVACLDQPSQRINGNWKQCPDATPKDITRQGDANYRNWLLEIVNGASKEVAQAPHGGGSSCASPALMMSLMDQESLFNPMTTNTGGDHGIAQFQIGTAEATVRFLEKVAPENSPMRNLVRKSGGLVWKPRECQATSRPWDRVLTPECQRALAEQCVENGRLVASLYCPQFAVRLQAYHIKQICEEEVEINGVNVTQVLQGNGDPVAQARFVVSRYNRGMRIYNSAAHYFAQYGKFPSAHEYGVLYDVRRPRAFADRNSDPFNGGNLLGHTINRCYNWRVTGLCGGIKGTIFNHYLNMTCAAAGTPASGNSTSSTGVAND